MDKLDVIEVTRDMASSLPHSFDVIRPIIDTCLEKRASVLIPVQMLRDIGALPDFPVLTYEWTGEA